MSRPRQSRKLSRLLPAGVLLCCLGPAKAVLAQDNHGGDPLYHLFGLDTLQDADWTRHFNIGALAGFNIRGRFSLNGTMNISGHNPAAGVFDDGYVIPDAGSSSGYTSDWGYQSASQYNAASGNLVMHSAATYTAATPANANHANGLDAGFELTYGDTDFKWGRAKVGWEFGFGLLPVKLTDNTTIPVTVSQNSYTFNTGGGPINDAPYNGGPNQFNGQLLGTNYTKGVSSTQNGQVTGTRTLDSLLYTIRLGPTMYWDLNRKMGLFLSAGPVVGLAQNRLSYNETITYNGSTAVNSGSYRSLSLVYGGYVGAVLTYHAPENADLFIGAQYMPLTSATVSGGGREARLQLSGAVYVSAGVNWSF